jgi:hypothetical protein
MPDGQQHVATLQLEGGYGVGSTNKEGHIIESLVSQSRFWDLDPDDYFKGRLPC